MLRRQPRSTLTYTRCPCTALFRSVILALLGVLPGMPHLIILPAAIAAGAFAWKLNRDAKRPAAAADAPEDAEPVDLARIGWDEVTADRKSKRLNSSH